MSHIFSHITNSLWCIEPKSLKPILSIAAGEGDPVALAERLGRPLDNTHTVEMHGDTAVIPVIGPVFRYANLFTAISGATSTQVLATDIREALDNPHVRRIVLDIDSPGGEATGIHELSEMIYAARGSKKIIAYVGGMAASAAYWIASAADQIVLDRTAIVGCIGVVCEVRDTTERDAKKGIRTFTVVSSASPKKRMDYSSDAGRAELQRRVDAMATVFVEKVARNRGVSDATVKSKFGQGELITADAAISVKAANALGSLEGVIAGKISKASGASTKPKANHTTTRTSLSSWDKTISNLIKASK